MKTKLLLGLVGLSGMTRTTGSLLACLWLGAAPTAVEAAAEQPRNQEVASALEIIERGPVSGRHAAVRRLSELGTPEARTILLDVALGRHGRGSQTWAARCFVKAMEQPREARALLVATNQEIVTIGLLALRGEAVDQGLLADLKRLLQSPDVHVRVGCARIIRHAPANQSPAETVRAVIESIRTVHTIDRADEPMKAANESISVRTEAGWAYETMISALSQSPSLDLKLLQELTPSDTGLPRDCLFIARAQRGERLLGEELRRILRSCPNSGVRWASLQPFADRGTLEDVPFLEQLAQTDPLAVELTDAQREAAADSLELGIPAPIPGVYYPIRSHVERLIRKIGRQAREAQ